MRYVGQTVNLKRRYRKHKKSDYGSKINPKRQWVEELFTLGLYPIIEQIEICPRNCANEREQYWIAYYREQYPDLLNVSDGG